MSSNYGKFFDSLMDLNVRKAAEEVEKKEREVKNNLNNFLSFLDGFMLFIGLHSIGIKMDMNIIDFCTIVLNVLVTFLVRPTEIEDYVKKNPNAVKIFVGMCTVLLRIAPKCFVGNSFAVHYNELVLCNAIIVAEAIVRNGLKQFFNPPIASNVRINEMTINLLKLKNVTLRDAIIIAKNSIDPLNPDQVDVDFPISKIGAIISSNSEIDISDIGRNMKELIGINVVGRLTPSPIRDNILSDLALYGKIQPLNSITSYHDLDDRYRRQHDEKEEKEKCGNGHSFVWDGFGLNGLHSIARDDIDYKWDCDSVLNDEANYNEQYGCAIFRATCSARIERNIYVDRCVNCNYRRCAPYANNTLIYPSGLQVIINECKNEDFIAYVTPFSLENSAEFWLSKQIENGKSVTLFRTKKVDNREQIASSILKHLNINIGVLNYGEERVAEEIFKKLVINEEAKKEGYTHFFGIRSASLGRCNGAVKSDIVYFHSVKIEGEEKTIRKFSIYNQNKDETPRNLSDEKRMSVKTGDQKFDPVLAIQRLITSNADKKMRILLVRPCQKSACGFISYSIQRLENVTRNDVIQNYRLCFDMMDREQNCAQAQH